jgi:hypothetical protein
VLVAALLFAGGCQRNAGAPAPAPAAPPGTVQSWVLPAASATSAPGLVATTDGRLLLSWIDSTAGRRNALQFSEWQAGGGWQSAPRTILVGDSLLVESANPPRLMATADGALWVDFLQRDAQGQQVLQLSRSLDGGFNWSAPVLVASAPAGGELGFATLWPQAQTQLGFAWLASASAPAIAGGRGAAAPASEPATAVHAGVFDASLRRNAVAVVDARACDCCQLATAMTSRGALLVYRDRSATEIRDIAATRFDGQRWSAPRPVHADHWTMAGCPVNGPAVAAGGMDAVVAWYTGAGPQPRVQLARSTDAGDTFAPPVVVDQGDAVLGRVAVARDAHDVWVLWMREDAGVQSLWLARYPPDLSHALQRVRVATLRGRGRVSGFPQLALQAGHAFVVWTDVEGRTTQLHGATL